MSFTRQASLLTKDDQEEPSLATDDAPGAPMGPRGPSSKTGRVVICDLGGIVAPDLSTVDSLARFQLSVQARGCSVHLRNVPPELRELLEVCGLSEVIPICEESPPVDKGQPEQGKHPGGVEEEAEPGDPAI